MNIFEPDTASVCAKNSIAGVSFYDSTSYLLTIESSHHDRFPLTLIKTTRDRESRTTEILMQNLREGSRLPRQPFNADWLLFVIMTSIFLYSLISAVSRKFFHDMKRFFLFRGIGDQASGDIQALFHWQSTVINLVSFLNVALFVYCAADYYEFIPRMIPHFVFWIMCSALVIVAVTVRHAMCRITGNLSDQNDTFSEYIITVYLSYRYGAVMLFIISVLILYTGILETNKLFIAGLAITAAVYIIRVVRLFLIFIRKNISVFYLILYLCALEFLPVAVLMKYFAGLF